MGRNQNDENCPLTPIELDAIKKQLLESIYADIGRSIVKKFLWVFGTVVLAIFTGLTAAGKIKFGG